MFGQEISPFLDTTCLGCNWFTTLIEFRAVCEVAPLCSDNSVYSRILREGNKLRHSQTNSELHPRPYVCEKFTKNVRAAVKSLSKYFTVQTTPSLTNLNHNPPHKPDMYVTPKNHTPDNNFQLLIFYTNHCFTI
jgi:hypothetical protein